jgi:AraC-like DNA-binding protein
MSEPLLLSAEQPLIKKRGRPKKNKMSFITAKRPAHRPQEFFWENHKKKMLQCFKQGYSLKEIAVEIGISSEHFCRQMAKNEELNQFVRKGQEISEKWWVSKGRTNLENRQFNSHLYQLMMMNLHDWGLKNKTKTEAKVEVNSNVLSEISDKLIDKLLENE